MARKTVKIAEFIAVANSMIAASPDDMTQDRRGIAALLERVLFDADAYAGFQYLASEFLPAEEQTLDRVLKSDYDDTRRRYLTHRKLR